MEDVGDSIDKMRIWHDNEGLTAGWKLDKVEIRKLHDSGKVRGYLDIYLRVRIQLIIRGLRVK